MRTEITVGPESSLQDILDMLPPGSDREAPAGGIPAEAADPHTGPHSHRGGGGEDEAGL